MPEPSSLCYCLTIRVAVRPPGYLQKDECDEPGSPAADRRVVCPADPAAGLSLTSPAKLAARDALEAKQGEPDFWTTRRRPEASSANSRSQRAPEALRGTERRGRRHQDDGRTGRGGPGVRGRTGTGARQGRAAVRGVRTSGDDERQARRGQRGRLDQAGRRRHRRLRLGRDSLPDVHPLGAAATASRSRTWTRNRTSKPASRASRSRSSATYAYGYMQSEIGVHRLVRISPFGSRRHAADVVRRGGRAAGVARRHRDRRQGWRSGNADVLHGRPRRAAPEQDAIGRAADPQADGRAGREPRPNKSQHKNNDNALKLLKARLYAIEEQKRLGDVVKRYDAKGEIAFGSQIRSYVLPAVHAGPRGTRRDRRQDPGGDGRARRRHRPVHAGLPAVQDGQAEAKKK